MPTDNSPKSPRRAPVYKPPFALPIEPSKIKPAVEAVQKALKDINQKGPALDIFKRLGFDTKVLDLLAGVAAIASVAVPVLAVASVAVEALKMFGVLKEGPSPLEKLVTARFDELERNVDALKVLIQVKDLRDHRVSVETFVADVSAYVRQSPTSSALTPDQLEADRTRLLSSHSHHATDVGILLAVDTWLATFDRRANNLVWPNTLHTLPFAPGTQPEPAPWPEENGFVFDHRLMVPMAAWAATSYLTCIRGIIPEYRSTGDFRDSLRDYADDLDDLAQRMRRECLGITHYTADDFRRAAITPAEIDWVPAADSDVVPFPHEVPVLKKTCSQFPVGAQDLRYHDNVFYGDFVNELFQAEFVGRPAATKKGGMDLRWIPPNADLIAGAFGNFAIGNPEECAAAANAQAERDYAELLSSSGYTQLVHLAAVLRNEMSEPTSSETVDVTARSILRDAGLQQDSRITSNWKLAGRPITAKVLLEPQDVRAELTLTTQPPNRARPFHYEIKLRTLASLGSRGSYDERQYGDFWRASYKPDPQHERCLVVETWQAHLGLGEATLASGPTPRSLHRDEGTLSIAAHTFDWWIPDHQRVEQPVHDDFGVDGAFTFETVGSGSDSLSIPRRDVVLFNLGEQPFTTDELRIPWKNGESGWGGERRDGAAAVVTLGYSFTWSGEGFELRLTNTPSDRNYVVFLVVEETLSSGTVLHTATPIPINGQLTYVPQTFFDQEHRAIAEKGKQIADFYKFYRVRHPGPMDPIIGWMRQQDFANPVSIERFLDLAARAEPELFGQFFPDVEMSDRAVTGLQP